MVTFQIQYLPKLDEDISQFAKGAGVSIFGKTFGRIINFIGPVSLSEIIGARSHTDYLQSAGQYYE